MDYSECDYTVRPFGGQGPVEKSIHTLEYELLLQLLRETRKKAAVTQIQLSEALEITQSQWSKFERGELRMDLVQLRRACEALGTTLQAFVTLFEQRLAVSGRRGRRR